jgi:DNA modification methylase
MTAIKDRIKELRRVPASSLVPNPKNWRQHPPAQQRAMAAALDEIGFADAMIAREIDDGKLQLIDGHLRQETAGDELVPVLVLDVSEDEADKLLVTLDPLAAMATADAEKLSDLISHMTINSDDLQSVVDGIAEDAGISTAPDIIEDEVPEPPADPITQPGDLWLLGDHRLLCGDATKAEDVGRLMGGETASMLFTDPPYGVNHVGGTKDPRRKTHRSGGVVHNDDADQFLTVVVPSLSHAVDVTKDGACWYVAGPAGPAGVGFASWLLDAGILRQMIVWVKHAFVFGRSDYHFRHEMVFYGWKPGASHHAVEDRSQDTVWEFDRGDKSVDHPTSKPVELVSKAISNSTSRQELVYDPFLGSGTAVIASEQLNRKCYGLEISPQYCDVIVKRWESLTGKTAERA